MTSNFTSTYEIDKNGTELNRTLEPEIKTSVKAELSRRYKNIITKEIKDAWYKEKRLQEKQNIPTPETSDQI